MQRSKYATKFKDKAVKQVIDKGHSVVDVAKRLGIPDNVLYTWVSKFKKADQPESSDLKAMQAEVAKLKSELRRTKEERDILKKDHFFISEFLAAPPSFLAFLSIA
jgi:transposase